MLRMGWAPLSSVDMGCKVRKAVGGRVSPSALSPDALRQNQSPTNVTFMVSLRPYARFFLVRKPQRAGFCRNSSFFYNTLSLSWPLKKFSVLRISDLRSSWTQIRGTNTAYDTNKYHILSGNAQCAYLIVYFRDKPSFHSAQIAQQSILGLDNHVGPAPNASIIAALS